VLEVEPATLGVDAGSLALKLELTQCAGSFKARGAFLNLLRRAVPPAGVVAASGGNHGVAVAYAAHRLGVPAAVFVPTISDPAKVERIRSLGARLVVGGDRYADALAASEEWAAGSGALPIHAFDQRETLVGQATLALELTGQCAVDTVLVPVGGGGLIGGIAAYLAGEVKVVGVEPTGAPTLHAALACGAPTDAPTGSVAADALAPRRVGELMFPIAQRYVSEVVLVEDDAIRDAQRVLWRELRSVAEPAASVGVAALRSGVYRPAPGERVAVVLSGGNATLGNVPA
jgi:threonine dehydratase